MSMISSLIDELRKSADEWNESNMFELAHMCSEAADAIWQLRDDLQRANDAVQDAEHDESMAWDRVRKAEADNAKLRELVKMMWLACKSYGIVGGTYAYPDRNSNVDEQVRFEPLLHELGIEVD